MDKFQNKYRIPSARLKGYDYGANGMYYVTICTKNRLHYFGEIVSTPNVAADNLGVVETDNVGVVETDDADVVETDNYPSLQPTEIGKIAIKFWQEIPEHFPFVELDEFIIMPNHIHGILVFNKPDKTDWTPNQFGVQSQNLGSVIRGYKASLKRFANQNNIEFEWQPRYHDRIIRDERGLNAVRRYIIDNPANWNNDLLNMKSNVESNVKSNVDVETGNL
ncbi:MAG: transposase [Bacteroidia bacterium]